MGNSNHPKVNGDTGGEFQNSYKSYEDNALGVVHVQAGSQSQPQAIFWDGQTINFTVVLYLLK